MDTTIATIAQPGTTGPAIAPSRFAALAGVRLRRLTGMVALALAVAFTGAAARPDLASAATPPASLKYVTCQAGFSAFGTWYRGFMQVNAPNMWARNTTSAQDKQLVAFKARVVRLDGSFVTQSTWRYAWAYDNSAARFSAADALYAPTLARGNYKVIYDLYWYANATTAASSGSYWAPGYVAPVNAITIATYCAI